MQVAAGVGDVGASGEAEGVQGQVAHGGQVAGSRTGSELGIVLVEGDVAGPVQTVFEADDAVDDLFAGAHTVEAAGVTAQPEDLPGARGTGLSSQAVTRIVRRSVRP